MLTRICSTLLSSNYMTSWLQVQIIENKIVRVKRQFNHKSTRQLHSKNPEEHTNRFSNKFQEKRCSSSETASKLMDFFYRFPISSYLSISLQVEKIFFQLFFFLFCRFKLSLRMIITFFSAMLFTRYTIWILFVETRKKTRHNLFFYFKGWNKKISPWIVLLIFFSFESDNVQKHHDDERGNNRE